MGDNFNERPMTSRRVLYIFLAAVVILVSQSVFFRFLGPFHPAIAMPGFSGTGGYDKGFVYRSVCDIVAIQGDGITEYPVDAGRLFSPLPGNAIPKILAFAFSPSPTAYGKGVPGPLRAFIRSIIPGYFASRESGSNPAVQDDKRAWLDKKLEAISPSSKPIALEFRWKRIGEPAPWTRSAGTTEFIGTLRIDFETPSSGSAIP